jgi:hypothetical protein
MFMLLIVGAALMISLALLGMYVGYIFQEVKRRPVYLLRDVHSSASHRSGASHRPPRAEDDDPRDG